MIKYCFGLIATLLLSSPICAKEKSDMFPPAAIEASDYYKNWYGPTLEELGEKPIWKNGALPPEREVIRFTFMPGAMLVKGPHASTIRVTIPKTGHATVIAKRRFLNRGRSWFVKHYKGTISAEQAGKLKELYQKSDLLKFEVGTWENPEEISIHCTELTMEHALNGKYNVSHVLISCNQPQKLMPLVDYIVDLARMKPKQLFYHRFKDAPTKEVPKL